MICSDLEFSPDKIVSKLFQKIVYCKKFFRVVQNIFFCFTELFRCVLDCTFTIALHLRKNSTNTSMVCICEFSFNALNDLPASPFQSKAIFSFASPLLFYSCSIGEVNDSLD